ncbi:MAG: VgrG-related protein [Anaerolineae bacterium]|nr:VgrG-related protein [Anaerolineae bacterium]
MPQKYLTQFFIKIGGQNVPQEFMAALIEVVVDTSLHLPSMFTIQLNDANLKWVDDTQLLDIGKEVEISTKTGEEQGALEGVLIKGEITALEPDFSAEGRTTLLIRGYDKSHRLHRGKKTRTFLQVKDSDLVSKIAGEAGLSAQADTTTVTYDYILQNNQTNMEFLLGRAARIGYQVYAAEGKLYFKKGDATLGDGPELKLGEALRSFRPCFAATHQADKFIVKGWDGKAKTAITNQQTPSSSLNQGGMTQTGGAKAQSAFSAAEATITDQPVFTVDEATAIAIGLSNDISREFVEAEGMGRGDPRVKAGYTVTIENVGTRFGGKYLVTQAIHRYTEDGYQTTFSITGRRPNTLSHLLGGNGGEQESGSMRGVVTGLVTNLSDPDDLGRVKVKYGWLGDDIESDWMRIAAPMAGAERGFYYLPEVNDEVLVAFEHGDVHHPYIVGMLWSSTDKPPKPNSEATASGKVKERIFKSTSGHIVIFDDSDGAEKITIRDKTEKNEIIIDSSANSMTFNVEGDFTVVAKGKVSITSTGDMALESKANGTLKTTGNLNAEATGNATVKGTQTTVEGSAKSTLKGATVGVEGSAMTEVKGGIVKIN